MSVVQLLRRKFDIDWRQQDAIDKLNRAALPNCRVFAFEDVKFRPGCRKFVASGIRDFYLWYRACPPDLRHFYELILESTPCRLYFDLEFSREHNPPELDGPQMVRDFCRIACSALRELLAVDGLDPAGHILALDSSSAVKFSAHLILHIPAGEGEAGERLFPDNSQFKRIAMFICSKLLQERLCLVNTSSGSPTYLCDLSVYTKNRNFRLFQSSKCGKRETLQLAEYCHFYGGKEASPNRTAPKNAQVFLDSLVIPHNFHKCRLFDQLERMPQMRALDSRLATFGREIGNIGSNQPVLAFPAVQQYFKPMEATERVEGVDENFNRTTRRTTTELNGGTAPSPFPALDEYMLNSVFRKFNAAAEIRVWRLICTKCEAEDVGDVRNVYQLQFQLNKSRFCMNRGREHRSQNVYWVVDLAAFFYVQRCFDSLDCPNYVSPAFALPSEICARLHGQIGTVFTRIGIPAGTYVLPALDTLRHYQADSDSFNKSAEWREKYGNFDFLELFTPIDEYRNNSSNEGEEQENNHSKSRHSSGDSVVFLP